MAEEWVTIEWPETGRTMNIGRGGLDAMRELGWREAPDDEEYAALLASPPAPEPEAPTGKK